MRQIERWLTGLCLGGSIVAGVIHAPEWLLVTPLCFSGLMVAEDRQVRHQIGGRAWPSEGYARFLFGTNLYRAVRNTFFSATIYAIASMAASLLSA